MDHRCRAKRKFDYAKNVSAMGWRQPQQQVIKLMAADSTSKWMLATAIAAWKTIIISIWIMGMRQSVRRTTWATVATRSKWHKPHSRWYHFRIAIIMDIRIKLVVVAGTLVQPQHWPMNDFKVRAVCIIFMLEWSRCPICYAANDPTLPDNW